MNPKKVRVSDSEMKLACFRLIKSYNQECGGIPAMTCAGLNDEEGKKRRNNPWQRFILLRLVVCGSVQRGLCLLIKAAVLKGEILHGDRSRSLSAAFARDSGNRRS